MNKTFGMLFILTGIFAIAGGLYTWGDGSIFDQNELIKVLIPWADILLTGPLSIICGYGILKKQNWASMLGLCTSGIYVFGSFLVFISVVWHGNYALHLLVPAFSGFFIGMGFTVWTMRNNGMS